MMRQNHRQKLEQAQIHGQLELQFPEDPIKIKANATDISQGGLGLNCSKRIPVGRRVMIRIGFLSPHEVMQFETVDGMVKWCRTHGFGFSVGIQFSDLNPQYHPRLTAFLQQNNPSRGIIHDPSTYSQQD